MYEQWHPLGVVGIISAFNFPVAVWSWNAFLAAVCGDISVWKPSHHTPLCAIAVQKICNEVIEAAKLPPIFQLFIPADNALASRFVDDKRVALMSFTGSTSVGRHVGERIASRLGRSLLELGGNNAIIVDEFANLTSSCPPCSLARSERPASAARRRGGSSCTSRGSTKSSDGWSRATSR
jgi:aldehyde dehydrogenase (NAD+)